MIQSALCSTIDLKSIGFSASQFRFVVAPPPNNPTGKIPTDADAVKRQWLILPQAARNFFMVWILCTTCPEITTQISGLYNQKSGEADPENWTGC